MEKRTFFTSKDDVLLLREAVAAMVNLNGSVDWESVAGALGREVTGRAAKDRVNTLLQHFHSNNEKNIKRSGTEEEYDEKMQLLQELHDITEDLKSKKKEEKKKQDHKDNLGVILREAALKRKLDSKGCASTESDEPEAGTSAQSRSKRKPNKAESLGDFIAVVKENEKKKQELDETRLKLEEKRLKMEDEKAKALMSERSQMMEIMLTLAKKIEK